MDFDAATLRNVAIQMIIVVCSLGLHEWGHAYMADRLGDHTPRSEGRVTLNPLAHIDLIGTILLPGLAALGFFGGFAIIGWAKPVYTNPANFRHGYRDQAWVTIAGPAMNLFLAFLATLAAALCMRIAPGFAELFLWILRINIALMVFNLLPFPPLDGSKFLIYWFGMKEETYARLTLWSGIVMLVLINLKPFRAFLSVLIEFASIPFGILLRLLG